MRLPKLEKEEKVSIIASQARWTALVYELLPAMMLIYFHGTSEFINIEKFDVIYDIESKVTALLTSYCLFRKDKNEVGFRLYVRTFTIVTTIVYILPITTLFTKVFSICLVTGVLIRYAGSYGEYKNPILSARLSGIYTIYYTIVLIIAIAFNPLKEIFLSYFIITTISDMLWFVLLDSWIYDKHMLHKLYLSKINYKEEFKSIVIAVKMEFADTLVDIIIKSTQLVLITMLPAGFTLTLYLAIEKSSLVSVLKGTAQQYKRCLVHYIQINRTRLINISYIILTVEAALVILVSISVIKEPTDYKAVIIMFVTLVIKMWIEIRGEFYTAILKYNKRFKIVFIATLLAGLIGSGLQIWCRRADLLYLVLIPPYLVKVLYLKRYVIDECI